MRMEITHYLPHEELKITNYPELSKVEAEIDMIQRHAVRVNQALGDYNEGRTDRVDVDITDIQRHIGLCRYVADVMGRASNVCYDVLMDLRSIQQGLHDILFAYRRFGSEYIGTPTKVDEGGIG